MCLCIWQSRNKKDTQKAGGNEHGFCYSSSDISRPRSARGFYSNPTAAGSSVLEGKTVMCLGNTENTAGSDVAGISMRADKVDGGWILNGTKAYVTNGLIADLGVITAVSDPKATRNKRLSNP
jgi:hypothetical protein